MPLTLPCPFAWCDLGRLLSQHQVAAVRTARPQGTIAGRVCAAGRTSGKLLLRLCLPQALRRRRKGRKHHSCRLRLQYMLRAPAVRLRCRLPPMHAIASPVAWFPFAPAYKLVLQRVVWLWCARQRRFAMFSRPPSPPPPAHAPPRAILKRPPAAAQLTRWTGHRQAVAHLQATLPRRGTPRPVLCVLSQLARSAASAHGTVELLCP